jgi:N-acetylglucosaminyl-diphospho-decaprenol L-rhamnosyltransferase
MTLSISASPCTLSIVSHGQATLVQRLLQDLDRVWTHDFEVIVTVNIPASDEDYAGAYSFPLQIVRNPSPKGFGANHNAAFSVATGRHFAVLNPDIRITSWNQAGLLRLFADPEVGAVAPLVYASDGTREDSARRFPTWTRLTRRLWRRFRQLPQDADYPIASEPAAVDWVAGMFIIFRREAYEEVRGFDSHRFFMYYEDVDICRRLRRSGWNVLVDPDTRVIHDAQRASHRDFRHLRWHVTSTLRYLFNL